MVITVSDNGIGISPARLASIFDLFGQEEHPPTIRAGGLGIGLAVVRALVEAHGGAIVAHSSGENQGSKFIVTLPIRHGCHALGPAFRQEQQGDCGPMQNQ